ncbi:imidazole glycerol phosphate synthase subunit HisH [Mucisphaera sp.]|uniref:imidazole glycerol phosphate synthase subunit HisH n=1 Tax=Mucisphaera sp. TaxID=2913024 RepID=UPI003D0E77D4
MLGIVDYGMGNLRSVQKAIERVGGSAEIVSTPAGVESCERLILPGVGAFADGMRHLRERGLMQPVLDFAGSGRSLLGICLGMQLLFTDSEETSRPGEQAVAGLGLVPGHVRRFSFEQEGRDRRLKVPHMGWNEVCAVRSHGLLEGLSGGEQAYFVHGYYCRPDEGSDVLGVTDYGGSFCSVVSRGNLLGTQFHPEKSQRVGLGILRNFLALTPKGAQA